MSRVNGDADSQLSAGQHVNNNLAMLYAHLVASLATLLCPALPLACPPLRLWHGQHRCLLQIFPRGFNQALCLDVHHQVAHLQERVNL